MLLKDSLSGNSKTCIFCTIADEPEMVEESKSTLKYGLNCGQVKLKVSEQKATNLADETRRLERILSSIDSELRSLRQRGCNGGMDDSHPKPTRDHFIANYKIHQ